MEDMKISDVVNDEPSNLTSFWIFYGPFINHSQFTTEDLIIIVIVIIIFLLLLNHLSIFICKYFTPLIRVVIAAYGITEVARLWLTKSMLKMFNKRHYVFCGKIYKDCLFIGF